MTKDTANKHRLYPLLTSCRAPQYKDTRTHTTTTHEVTSRGEPCLGLVMVQLLERIDHRFNVVQDVNRTTRVRFNFSLVPISLVLLEEKQILHARSSKFQCNSRKACPEIGIGQPTSGDGSE